jgi:hypothetical protein
LAAAAAHRDKATIIGPERPQHLAATGEFSVRGKADLNKANRFAAWSDAGVATLSCMVFLSIFTYETQWLKN